jgi:hypothetical protein
MNRQFRYPDRTRRLKFVEPPSFPFKPFPHTSAALTKQEILETIRLDSKLKELDELEDKLLSELYLQTSPDISTILTRE